MMVGKTLRTVLEALNQSASLDLDRKQIFLTAINQNGKENPSFKAIVDAVGRALDEKYIKVTGYHNSLCETCGKTLGRPQHMYSLTETGHRRLREFQQ